MALLPPKAIDEFQALWKKHYGAELPRDQAVIRAEQIMTFVKLLVEGPPPPKDWKPGSRRSHCDACAHLIHGTKA